MAVTWGEYLNRIGRRAHLSTSKADERTRIEDAALEGIEMVEGEAAWSWMLEEQTLTPVANTYQYAWPSDLVRFEARSFRYAARPLDYVTRPENLIDELGPDWRTNTDKAGTPRYVTAFGRTFWLARMPDAAFVAANDTIYYWGYVTDLETIAALDADATDDERDATALRLPRRALTTCVAAALSALLQLTDDGDWRAMEQRYQRHLLQLRGYDEAVRSEALLRRPDWGRRMRF